MLAEPATGRKVAFARLKPAPIPRMMCGLYLAERKLKPMADFDLVVRGGTVVSAVDQARRDVGVREGPA